MKKNILTCYLLLVCTTLSSQTFNEWKDPVVNEVKDARKPRRTLCLLMEFGNFFG